MHKSVLKILKYTFKATNQQGNPWLVLYKKAKLKKAKSREIII